MKVNKLYYFCRKTLSMSVSNNHLSESARILSYRSFDKELIFQTSRSSGPGGQNVNKTETRVELRFDVFNSQLLSNEEKELIFLKLKTKISSEGILIIAVQDSRSQLANKQLAEQRFLELLANALRKQKSRKATKPSAASQKRRLITKRYNSLKKELRGRISDE